MPELPEVETTVLYLRKFILGKELTGLSISNGGESQLNVSATKLDLLLRGKKLEALSRRGKWMLFEFELAGDSVKIVGHLRMSGRYKIEPEVVNHPHNRFQLNFASGTVANYLDQRRFGTFQLVSDFTTHPALAALGVDALAEHIDESQLLTQIHRRRTNLYTALLDQTVIAGLGNIYVNETLHAAGIHPMTPTGSLQADQLSVILTEMRRILLKALEMKGTTLTDNLYQDPEGKTGEFAKLLQVYGKKHDPDIDVLKIGGRSVFVHRQTKP